ncbi:hypothetical protein EDC96DRAFT_224704 [Choanephora cucurbitarum]|nr:hypothetical protein EDC96DRAFT_224704 [Choanephora cucurbitarum]
MTDIKTHLLPFSVQKEESINTKKYLQIQQKEEDTFETVIHGRKLLGRAIRLEIPTQGHVWYRETEEELELKEESIAEWHKSNTTVSELILWKKDQLPDPQDPRIHSLHSWVSLSQAIHEPIPL